jgi:hypothetical protein
MEPIEFLWLLIAYTVVAAMVCWLKNSGRARELRELAAQWHMHYVPDDRLRVAWRIKDCLPVPGAADVCVIDLMYSTEEGQRRYIFTVEYGVGTVHSQRRRRRVMAFDEIAGSSGPERPVALRIAPEGGNVLDRYREMAQSAASAPAAVQAPGVITGG